MNHPVWVSVLKLEQYWEVLDRLEALVLEGRVKLKCILEMWGGVAWILLIWQRVGTGAVSYEDINDILGAIQSGGYLG